MTRAPFKLRALHAIQQAFRDVGDWIIEIGNHLERITHAERDLAEWELNQEADAIDKDGLFWMDQETRQDLGGLFDPLYGPVNRKEP